MAFNVNDTRTMLAALERTYAPSTTLVDTFFPDERVFTTKVVDMEMRKGDRKMAPFAVPGTKGVNLARGGSEIKTYTPPLMKPKRVISVEDVEGRGFGEGIYSTKTPAERAAEMRAKDLVDLRDACYRRQEYMAAQLLINGSYECKGYADDGTTQVVDTLTFGFTQKTTLSGGDTWDNASAKIYDCIGDASAKIRQNAGIIPTVAIVSDSVVKYLMDNTQLLKWLNVPNANNLSIMSIQPRLQRPDLMRVGLIQSLNLEIYSYAGGYADDETGEFKPYIPADHVIIGAPKIGRRLYGAVSQMEDDKALHTYASQFVPKYTVDTENDTSSLALSSRCVIAPDWNDLWCTIKVK